MFFKRKIKALGRVGILYRDGSVKVRVNAEFIFDPLGVIVYCETPLKDNSTRAVIDYSPERKSEILNEVCRYFDGRGYRVLKHPEDTEP